MAFPPDDVKASDLFRKLQQSPRPSEVIDFPRRETGADGKLRHFAKVRVQVVDLDQVDQARMDAERWIKSKHGMEVQQLGASAREVLGDRVAREILAVSVLSVEPVPGSEQLKDGARYHRIFRTADDLGVLRDDELTALWTAQRLVQRRYGPYEGNLESDEQVTAWMRRLTEGASEAPLALLDSHQLVELTMSLSERAYLLSALLGCQRSSLPDTLGAALDALGIGTTSFGVLPAIATRVGLGHDDLGITERDTMSDEDVAALMGVLPSEPIDAEQVAEIQKKMFGTD